MTCLAAGQPRRADELQQAKTVVHPAGASPAPNLNACLRGRLTLETDS